MLLTFIALLSAVHDTDRVGAARLHKCIGEKNDHHRCEYYGNEAKCQTKESFIEEVHAYDYRLIHLNFIILQIDFSEKFSPRKAHRGQSNLGLCRILTS